MGICISVFSMLYLQQISFTVGSCRKSYSGRWYFFWKKSVVFTSLYFLINNHQYLSYSEYLPTVLIVSITMFFHAVFLSSKLHAAFLLFSVDTFLIDVTSPFKFIWKKLVSFFLLLWSTITKTMPSQDMDSVYVINSYTVSGTLKCIENLNFFQY